MKTIISILLVSIVIWSCNDTRAKDLMIQKMIKEDVENRVENFIRVREEVCQKQVFERATILADSMMLDEVRRIKINATVPYVPDKPKRQEVKVKEAYEKVRPLFDSLKNSRQREYNQSLKNS